MDIESRADGEGFSSFQGASPWVGVSDCGGWLGMLSELHVTHYALVEDLTLEFAPGLTVLTGETGAGKSILVEALSAALGGRVGSEVVRKGCDCAQVDALFEPSPSSHALSILAEAGRDPKEGRLILSRRIGSSGKSRCYLNNRPVGLSLVKALGDHLVDFHGQHTHQLLMKPEEHLLFLDAAAGLEALRDEVASLVKEEQRIAHRLSGLVRRNRESRERKELLQYQVRELEALKPVPGEEDTLRTELSMLEGAEQLREAGTGVQNALYEEDGSVAERLRWVLERLDDMARLGAKVKDQQEAVRSAIYLLEDTTRGMDGLLERVEEDPERLEKLRDRMSSIRILKRRYRCSDLAEVLEAKENELERLGTLDGSIEKAKAERAELLERLRPLALELSRQRKEAAEMFSGRVERELGALAMHEARLDVRFSPLPAESAWGHGYPGDATGLEQAEFLLAANPGEGPRPLARVASGGEISRIMLAIKAALERDRVGTMVFDEIDVGIGGKTADLVGEKLRAVAAHTQVLCVTHLAQIAAQANGHYRVVKRVRKGRTTTGVVPLQGESRVAELARMLSGKPTAASLTHAAELLARVGRS